jgi:hypothetical protein
MPILPVSVFAPTPWLAIANAQAIVDTHENYPKQTYRNRFSILGANGVQTLTLPVEGQKGQKIPTNLIKLSQGTWKKQHLASIKSAYGRSAFFEHFYPDVEDLYQADFTHLHQFAAATLQLFIRYKLLSPLQYCETTIARQSLETLDFRECFEPSFQWPALPAYPQVFGDRYPFQPGLSGLDLLMNLGPRGVDYLLLIKKDCLGASKSPAASSLL